MASGTIQHAAPENANSLFKTISYTITFAGDWDINETLSSNAHTWGFSTPSGYTPVCIKRYSSGKANLGVCQVNALAVNSLNNPGTAITLRCVKTFSGDDFKPRIDILYARSEFVC